MKQILAVLLSAVVLCAAPPAPSVSDAKKFLDEADARLLKLTNEAGQASWVQSNFITDDTEAIAARGNERQIEAAVELAKSATQFDKVTLPPDMARKMKLLKLSLVLAAPSNDKERTEVTRIASELEGMYGKGRYCPGGAGDKSKCLDLQEITRIMANSRDEKQLLDVWKGWRTVCPRLQLR
jgi:peptidyl-dipeptidase A